MSIFNSQIKKSAALILGVIALSACTQTNPARITDLSDSPSEVGTNPATKGVGEVENLYERPQIQEVNSYSNQNNAAETTSAFNYNRDYSQIPKGTYRSNTYTVQRGDTLYYIAWISGHTEASLAAQNNMTAPYTLNVGQVLNVSNGTYTPQQSQTTVSTPVATVPVTTQTVSSETYNKLNQMAPSSGTTVKTTTTTTTTATKAPTTTTSSVSNIQWQWPASGKVKPSINGIDIAGSYGDKVVAAADGKVVYVGTGVAGYGKLIIIKHNNDYLTAYGDNKDFLVKEQQNVKRGQQIATMGQTAGGTNNLHFEIRYKTKSIDPLKYLPKK